MAFCLLLIYCNVLSKSGPELTGKSVLKLIASLKCQLLLAGSRVLTLQYNIVSSHFKLDYHSSQDCSHLSVIRMYFSLHQSLLELLTMRLRLRRHLRHPGQQVGDQAPASSPQD